ncbi:PP2C family protein-serine/threonine phosphatase [Halomonas sp. THAF12]|uniref:PP2C family protein-serine/threonine phosphatase n=1 Tax=Halomonas sp. B23F22_10 TaxID=3459515 RepID=UPI00373E5B28
MQASWFSRQGGERTRNSDAAAVSQQDQHLLAVLVDGAEKGPGGAELARHWADVVLQVLADASARSPAAVHARLKQEQTRLRHGFLHDIASYCMIRLDLKTLATQVWHCGDCRVGLQLKTETRWLTTPHILAQQPGLPPPRSSEEQERHEQQLTRCLNARRFRTPDYQALTLQQGQTLLLSTDGYWKEYLDASTPEHSLRDDASLLTLPVEQASLVDIGQDSDTDNLNHL